MVYDLIQNHDEMSSLKTLIENFIDSRLQEKLSNAKNKNEKEIEKIRYLHQIDNWINNAASRVSQLQLVTHAIKFHNPDARGSSFYLPIIDQVEKLNIVSSHTLFNRSDDVVGNAAVLDVFKFLQLNYEGENLLSRVLRNDEALIAALPGTLEQKVEWLTAFANIIKAKSAPATHTLAKQIYFPIENNQYHILAPLFPTSLVHAVFEQVQARFNEATKNARKAKKEKKAYPHGYREYINLLVQNFGGSKPQNISQLNSTRGGKSYLLPSFPPKWKAQTLKPPLNIKSIFSIFEYRVKHTINILRKFLKKTDYNNQLIRQTRADLITEICDQLLFFAGQIQELPAGWSKNSDCKLHSVQALWLDPGRAEVDEEWRRQREGNEWKDEISHQFALWLNARLKTKKIILGDDEYKVWKHLLKHELLMLKEGI